MRPPRLVRDILKPRLTVVTGPDATVQAAAVQMTKHACGSILICDGGRLIGIFTERDLMTRVVAEGLDPSTTKLDAVMTHDPERIEDTETGREALRRMDEGCFRHLPVMEDGRVVGVLSLRDLPPETLARMQPEMEQRHSLAERLW